MIKINLNSLNNVFSKVSDIKNNLTSTDTNKPLSAAQGKELKTQVDTKVDKVTGKELSSNDFTDSLKNKLENDVLSANFGYIDEDLKIHFTVASLDLDVDDNIIQQGEKTDVQATLTDDKEEPIEDIRVNFYEIYTPTINLSGNSIIQSGQRADITAKVKDSDGSIVAGETVYFFESTTYRCIGKGVTDDNGIAHITHSSNDNGATFTQSASNGYLGTGKGQVGVIASMDKKLVDGSIVSETYEVLDCYVKDMGTLNDHNDSMWTAQNVTFTPRQAEYTDIVKGTGSSLLISLELPIGSVIEFELKQIGGTKVNYIFGLRQAKSYLGDGTSLNNLGANVDEWVRVKVELKDDGYAIATNLDDTSSTDRVNSTAYTSTPKFAFWLSDTASED